MQLHKGTGYQIFIVGHLKSMPKYDKKNQSSFVILERKKIYFDSARQFLQEDITWFRIILNSEDTNRIKKLSHLGDTITVTGDINTPADSTAVDFTKTMIEISATNVDLVSPSKNNKRTTITSSINTDQNYLLH